MKHFGSWRLFAWVGLVALVAAVVRWCAGHPLTMRTDAMFPTVFRGEILWIAQKEPSVGDVVQVDLGGDYGLYRIVASEGQDIELKEKRLFVDGVRTDLGPARTVQAPKVDCEFAHVPAVTARIAGRTFEFLPGGGDASTSVPDGSFFLLGDHRSNAGDSRAWGPLAEASVQGVASRVLWSWDTCKSAVRWHRLWNSIE